MRPQTGAYTLLACAMTAAAQSTVPAQGFYNPAAAGGGWLTSSPTSTTGLGEPLNVVLSGLSDAYVLSSPGFFDFMYSVNMAGECLGQHIGDAIQVNLGDGQGLHNETAVLRYDYGDYRLGSCQETVLGGNHLRYWTQNGTAANSGAIFMAVSVERNLTFGHAIEYPDGYDAGRDQLAGNATALGGTKSPLTNNTFASTVTYVDGFLPANTSEGINHDLVIDGRVAVLTVRVQSLANSAQSTNTTSSGSLLRPRDGAFAFLYLFSAALVALVTLC